MTREEASEAKVRDEEARLWITGLEAVQRKVGIKAVGPRPRGAQDPATQKGERA